MAKKTTKLGWEKANKHAKSLIKTGELTRDEHLELIKRMKSSRNEQDHRISVCLLEIFIKQFAPDFDQNFTLEIIIEYGESLAKSSTKEFGKRVLYVLMKRKMVPAIWVDKISDETSKDLRMAFAQAIYELSLRKANSLDRILGFSTYFMDDESQDVREIMLKVFVKVAERDSERMHYFMKEFEIDSTLYRNSLFQSLKEKLGWN